MDAAAFFGHMFGQAVSAHETIAVWSMPSKVCRFHAGTASAARRSGEISASEDVYFGCGLYRPGVGAGRGSAKDVTCITSLWADVDYGATHAKEGNPPDIVEAMKVVNRIGLRPSIVIDSGYGLHVYWLLTEALAASDDAATISRRFGATILECAKCLSYVVDLVHDISRVMRVPGTFNHKHNKKKPVSCLLHYSNPALRYEVESDIEDILVNESVSTVNKTSNVHVSAVILDPSRGPRADLIEALCANDPKAKKTWERKRGDLTDQSPSSYDMAMAHLGAQLGLSDQDIADLIMGWRVKHGEDTKKATRQAYVQGTIAKAKMSRGQTKAIDSLELSTIPSGSGQKDTSRERQKLLDMISGTLGVRAVKWLQHGTENAEYSLVLADGTDLLIGTIKEVLKQGSFREKLLESVGVMLPNLKAAQWNAVVVALTRLREVISNPEGSRVGQIGDWLASYFLAVPIGHPKTEGLGVLISDHKPFEKDGHIYVHASHLMRHVRFALQDNVGKMALAGMLRVAGWVREDISGTHSAGDNGRSHLTRSYWKKENT